MKRIKAYTAAVLTAAITLSAVPMVFAADNLDSTDVKKLLYQSSIASSAEYEELSGYDYVNTYTQDLADIKKLDEIGDPAKSFRSYGIPHPYADLNSYDEYKTWQPGDLIKQHKYYNNETRCLEYFIEDTAEPGKYASIYVNGDSEPHYFTASQTDEVYGLTPSYTNVMDFDKTAEVLSKSELTGISDLKLIHCDSYCWLVTAEQGEFVIPLYTRVNKRRENSVQTEWEVMPVKEYWKTELEFWLDQDDADEKCNRALSALKTPEGFYVYGDEIRDTNVLEEYVISGKAFTDTPPELDRYFNLIAELGGINGCGDGKFYPDNDITAEQIRLILNRLYKNDVDYTCGRSGAVDFLAAFNILEHFTGDWMETNTLEGAPGRIFENLGGVDTTGNVTRGQFIVMLGNVLDRHLWTYGIYRESVGEHGIYDFNEDITVIDYIRGGKLNGVLARSEADEQALMDKYLSWYYPAAGDILYEYYGDDSPELIAKMEKYGWKRSK